VIIVSRLFLVSIDWLLSTGAGNTRATLITAAGLLSAAVRRRVHGHKRVG
jgi:hypothetical protein